MPVLLSDRKSWGCCCGGGGQIEWGYKETQRAQCRGSHKIHAHTEDVCFWAFWLLGFCLLYFWTPNLGQIQVSAQASRLAPHESQEGHIKKVVGPRFPKPDSAVPGKYATPHFPHWAPRATEEDMHSACERTTMQANPCRSHNKCIMHTSSEKNLYKNMH